MRKIEKQDEGKQGGGTLQMKEISRRQGLQKPEGETVGKAKKRDFKSSEKFEGD